MHNLDRERENLLLCGRMFPLLGERVRVRGNTRKPGHLPLIWHIYVKVLLVERTG